VFAILLSSSILTECIALLHRYPPTTLLKAHVQNRGVKIDNIQFLSSFGGPIINFKVEQVKLYAEAGRSMEDYDDEEDFNGYDMRDAIEYKFGKCFDLEFQRVETMGQKMLYLNVMPFFLGSKRFRHRTEYDYLCHLQAVVEILVKYDRLDYVMGQMMETNKKPRPGTSPLVAVPLRLDLPADIVKEIW